MGYSSPWYWSAWQKRRNSWAISILIIRTTNFRLAHWAEHSQIHIMTMAGKFTLRNFTVGKFNWRKLSPGTFYPVNVPWKKSTKNYWFRQNMVQHLDWFFKIKTTCVLSFIYYFNWSIKKMFIYIYFLRVYLAQFFLA